MNEKYPNYKIPSVDRSARFTPGLTQLSFVCPLMYYAVLRRNTVAETLGYMIPSTQP